LAVKNPVATKVIERHRKMLADRQTWLPSWQLISEYVMNRQIDFTTTHSPGQFLTGNIFDGTAASANHLMASSFNGALWPNSSKTFMFKYPKGLARSIAGKKEVKDFYDRCTTVVSQAIESHQANFRSVLSAYMLDQGSFGISGINVIENDDYENPVSFEAVNAKMTCIDEGKNGFVDTVFLQTTMTVRQLVQEYGITEVSKKTRQDYMNGEVSNKVKVLRVVEPRLTGSKAAFGNQDMPIASIHLEIDEAHVLRDSGYNEMPIFITRFWQVMGEVYGRSPAFETMPNILDINNLRESLMIATEKILDPPLLVREDGNTDGGVINTSAKAINVRHTNGRIDNNTKAVETLVTIGDTRPTQERIDVLKEIIEEDFFKDRLMDFNNTTRMTLGEANLRNELRSQSLGDIFARQISELFNRVIERVFNICLGKGLLGVRENSDEANNLIAQGITPNYIPEDIIELSLSGKNVYDIEYLSPAARIMKYEEKKGIEDTTQFSATLVTVDPNAIDVYDFDEMAKQHAELSGAPSNCVRSEEEIAQIRKTKSDQQNAAAQLQSGLMQAKIAKDGAQAAQAASKAGVIPGIGPTGQPQVA
jgi:hypothetical protein